MSINPSSSRDLTLWAQLQPGGARVIPNSTGTWTNTGAQKLRFDSFELNPQNPINRPTYKTGKRSPLIGARGRQGATWRLSKPFIPSGAAGTPPEDSNLLQAIFGAAGTVAASTSVTYSLSDALNYLFLSRYNHTPGLTGATKTYVMGAVAQRARIILNQNFLQYEIEGTGIGVGDSNSFGSYAGSGDAVVAGGLTTYPAEPNSFSPLGDVIPGFGSGAGVSFNSSALAELRGNCEIEIDLGVEAIADGLNDAYPIGFVGGLRSVAISRIQCIDSDGTVLAALKQAAYDKTPGTFSFEFGSVAGSIVTVNLNNVQVGSSSWQENGAGLDIVFDKSDAAASDANSTDDMTLVLT